MTIDDVRELALTLPDAFEQPSYGTPGFRVGKKLFARFRPEDDSLVVFMPVEEAEMLVENDPATFFLTPHYRGYPCVLVRLAAVDRAELGDLLAGSWRNKAPRRLVTAFDAVRD